MIARSVTRRLARGFLGAQLAFGALSVAALIQAAPASAAVLTDEHDAWQGFTTEVDGRPMIGALTRMGDGGTAAFLASGEGLSLVMTDTDWSVRRGTVVPVVMRVDGQVFTGEAIARGRHLIEMPHVSHRVLEMFRDGAEATIAAEVEGAPVVWTLDLHGFTASMADGVRLIDAAD